MWGLLSRVVSLHYELECWIGSIRDHYYFLYIQGKRTILQLNFSFIND
jgi:hypothetical protein